MSQEIDPKNEITTMQMRWLEVERSAQNMKKANSSSLSFYTDKDIANYWRGLLEKMQVFPRIRKGTLRQQQVSSSETQFVCFHERFMPAKNWISRARSHTQ